MENETAGHEEIFQLCAASTRCLELRSSALNLNRQAIRVLNANLIGGLAGELETSTPALLNEAADWSVRFSESHAFPKSLLQTAISCIEEVLPDTVTSAPLADRLRQRAQGLAKLLQSPRQYTGAHETISLEPLAQEYLDLTLNGKHPQAMLRILDAAKSGRDIRDLYVNVLQAVQRKIGELWVENRISVPEEHFVTASTQRVLVALQPFVLRPARFRENIVAACMGSELHDLGIRMVADLLELDGWNTIYLGGNVPPETIPIAIKNYDASVLALSATMSAGLPNLAQAIKLARATRPLRILVGGRPFESEPNLWLTLGADGTARNATSAVLMVRTLLLGPQKETVAA